MTVAVDRKKVISIFEELISQEENETWLDELFYSSDADELIDEVREIAKQISKGMNWEYDLGPVIPSEQSVTFLVNSFGNELFNSRQIRKFVVDRCSVITDANELEEFKTEYSMSSS